MPRIEKSLSEPSKKQSVVLSAIKMALGTLSSRVLGLVRDSVAAAFFDRTITDAFVVAFRLPNFFRRLLGEGSLNVSFVPVYVEQAYGPDEGGKSRAANLASAVYTVLTLVSGILTVLGIIFMEPMMNFLVGSEEFAGIPGKLELTIVYARIMFVYLYLVTTYAFFMAVANALGAFFIPAMAPALFNLVLVLSCFVPDFSTKYAGLGLAYGVVLGGIVQLLMVSIQLYRMKALPHLTRHLNTPGLKLVLTNTIPGLLGLGVLQVISILNIYYAGLLPEGAHTYLYYADRLLELPQSLLAISLGTAMLPSLSGLLAQGQKEQMLKAAARYMRVLMFLSLPSAVGLFVLAEPIVKTLFGRGQFTATDVMMTSQVVQVYGVLLLVSGFTKVIVPSFYAMKDTMTPAVVSVAVVLAHIIGASTLLPIWGLRGLAMAVTLSALVNVVLLLVIYRRKIGALYLNELLFSVGRSLPGLFAMGLVAYYLRSFWPQVENVSSSKVFNELFRAGALMGIIGLCMLVYFITTHFAKVEEAQVFFGRLRTRFQKKR